MISFETIGAIAIGLGAGYALHCKYSRHASALQSVVQMFLAVIWMAAAIASILTGFLVIGMLMLALFFYFFLGNRKNVRESEIPDTPSEWRRKASNFNPFGYQNQR